MNQISQLIELEYKKIEDILAEYILELQSEIPSEYTEEKKVLISYDIDTNEFEMNSTILGEQHNFKGPNFENVFSLWKTIRQTKKDLIVKEQEKIKREIKKIEEFINLIKQYLEIEIMFNADGPVINYNINRKFNFIKVILNKKNFSV